LDPTAKIGIVDGSTNSLSQKCRACLVGAAHPEQGAGQFDVRQVVLWLLVPTGQQSTPPRQPGEGALDHPAAGRVRLLSGLVFLLLADAPDVFPVPALGYGLAGRRVIAARVQAQVLRLPLGRLGPLHHDRVERSG
jgi:hypothetical protein